jgi:hypothetical protein
MAKGKKKIIQIAGGDLSPLPRYPQTRVDKLCITSVKLLCRAVVASDCLKDERLEKKIFGIRNIVDKVDRNIALQRLLAFQHT